MTEEDEIDILGDFTLDNLLSKDTVMFDHTNLVSQNTDILNCDYTIHPQWLLDKPSANPACWYNTSTDVTSTLSNDGSSYSFEHNNCSDVTIEQPVIDDSGWTDKERDLLKRGIEIFGKSNTRLAQFIGSKTAVEIKHFLRNYYTDVELTCSNNVHNEIVLDNCVNIPTVNVDEVIDDTEIPATIEEVIASVTTAKPTVITKKPKPNLKSESAKQLVHKQKIFKQNNKNYKGKRCRSIDNLNRRPKGLVKFKFKTKLTLDSPTSKPKQKNLSTKNTQTETESYTQAQIVTGIGLSVPVYDGEEVIKIQKEEQDDDSDFEIDVEDFDTPPIVKSTLSANYIVDQKVSEKPLIDDKVNTPVVNSKEAEKDDTTIKTTMKKGVDLSELSVDVRQQLENMDIPEEEVKLDITAISDLEKAIHYEFFEDRPSKTPARYLKIRNHILNVWLISKPLYITKTYVRKGLQQCGDVNCIGRVHSYLEQIGAINFGCPQTSYIRPLAKLIYTQTKEKPNKDLNDQAIRLKLDTPRSRIKSKTLNQNGEGGCTITHNEFGEIINRMVINEEPTQKVNRMYVKKPAIKLTYCRPFTDENPQKFSIHLHLSALLLMDLHAHMSFNEVMGLVGGHWDDEQKKLIITRYEPCKNVAVSATHCDMCPISQSNATNIFHDENLQVLGWFHSHPTFAPEPSQQDLETQRSVQQWIGNDKPCIGIILSPFSLHGALIASPYRCLIVDKKENFEDQYVPYRFSVDVISSDVDVDVLLNRAWKLFNIDNNLNEENRIDFNSAYFQDKSLTHLEKYISSVKIHLAKCSDINKMCFDSVIEGFINVCSNKLLTNN